MAHKGQLGKVLFRRDWNLNVFTNNDGWGNRTLVHWPAFPNGLASIWNNTTWDCGPATFTAPNKMTWESDHRHRLATDWFTQFQVEINPNDSYTRYLRLITEQDGIILEITYGVTRVPAYGPTLQTDRKITSWNENFFDSFPATALEATFRSKLYADGPPE